MACSSKGVIDVDSDTSGSSEFLPSEVSESEERKKGKKRRHVRLRKYKMARPLVVPCQRQNARPGREKEDDAKRIESICVGR